MDTNVLMHTATQVRLLRCGGFAKQSAPLLPIGFSVTVHHFNPQSLLSMCLV